jgi:hypothetical protein
VPRPLHISPVLGFTLKLFVISRVWLYVVGKVSRFLLADQLTKPEYWKWSRYDFLEMWSLGDTGWYLNVAENGYTTQLGQYGQANYGFFPLLPKMMHYLGYFTGGPYIAGLLISNISLIISALLLWKIVALKFDTSTAKRSVVFLFLAPVGFMFSGVFTEALFLLLVLVSFYYSYQNKWGLVGVSGYLVSLTRPSGVFVAVSAGLEFLKRMTSNDWWKGLFLLLFPLGTLTFSLHNYLLTGDWLAYVHNKQIGWWVTTSFPTEALVRGFRSEDVVIIINDIYACILLALAVSMFFRLPASWSVYALIQILFPLVSGYLNLVCMFRYSLVVFPLYVLLALYSTKTSVYIVLVFFLALVQTALMVSFANGCRLTG